MNEFIFIIDGLKNGAGESGFYHFFNNATIGAFVGTFVAILLGSLFASWQYRKQKDIDRLHMRQDEVVNEILKLRFEIGKEILKIKSIYNYYNLKKDNFDKDYIENSRVDLNNSLLIEVSFQLGRVENLLYSHFIDDEESKGIYFGKKKNNEYITDGLRNKITDEKKGFIGKIKKFLSDEYFYTKNLDEYFSPEENNELCEILELFIDAIYLTKKLKYKNSK